MNPVQVTRVGSQIKLWVRHGIEPNFDQGVVGLWEAGTELAAAAICGAINQALGDHIQAIRRAEYEEGQRDRRAGRRKTWFARTLWRRQL